jgi:hypothetical protein
MIDQRKHAIDQSDPRLQGIVIRLDRYLLNALLINSGSLLFWMSPIILIVFIRNRFLKIWPDWIRLTVKSFVFVPERVVVG